MAFSGMKIRVSNKSRKFYYPSMDLPREWFSFLVKIVIHGILWKIAKMCKRNLRPGVYV